MRRSATLEIDISFEHYEREHLLVLVLAQTSATEKLLIVLNISKTARITGCGSTKTPVPIHCRNRMIHSCFYNTYRVSEKSDQVSN